MDGALWLQHVAEVLNSHVTFQYVRKDKRKYSYNHREKTVGPLVVTVIDVGVLPI
jgi:hypothetical protein